MRGVLQGKMILGLLLDHSTQVLVNIDTKTKPFSYQATAYQHY